jgi:hypothetical protein
MFIFTEENIRDIKNAVYTTDGIKDKHVKKIEGIKDGLFKDFNYSKYKVKNPPKNTSMIVYNELQFLKDLPEDDKYVEEHDDMEKVFEQVCKENNVEYPKELVENLINSAAGIVLDLKYHYNRPRPFQLASHYNMKLGEHVLESMKTPSYPSGHSTQGILVGKVLQTKLPINTDAFLEAGKRISYSRNIGRVHFPSDSKLGEDIGNALYQHIKHKI